MIAEAEALGDATAQGAKAAREAFAATPPSGQATSIASSRASSPRVCARRCVRRRARSNRQRDRRRSRRSNPFETRGAGAACRGARIDLDTRAGPSGRDRGRASSGKGPMRTAVRRRYRRIAEAFARRTDRRDRDGAAHPRARRRGLLAARPHRLAGRAVRGPAAQQAEGCRRAKPKITDRVGQPSGQIRRQPRRRIQNAGAGRRRRAARRALRGGPGRPAGQALCRLGDLAHRDGDARARRAARSRGARRHRNSRAAHHHDVLAPPQHRSGAAGEATPSRSRSTCRPTSRSAASRTCPAS